MKKALIAFAAAVALAFGGGVYAQTSTPTMSPSPTSMPDGAPSTGFGAK